VRGGNLIGTAAPTDQRTQRIFGRDTLGRRRVGSFRQRAKVTPHPAQIESLALAKFCQRIYLGAMSTMNISLPEPLKRFVDSQVEGGSYGTSSEYVRMLIRREQEKEAFRQLILDGMNSPVGSVVDDAYFERLRDRIRDRTR
jgi:antitoxin ParD1/3/4